MKNKYLLVGMTMMMFFSFHSSHAQITITSADMPSSNDKIRVSIGRAFTGMNARLTGANHTWDYSMLTSTSQTVDTFVSITSTGLLYWFQFAANSSFALKSNSPTVNLGVLNIDYEFDFFKKSTASYLQTGFGAAMNTFPLPVPYTPKDTIYRFPLHYNDTGLSPSAFSVSIPSLGYYGGNKTRTDTVDGWGTLTTPYGTFSVLRVKSVIRETDSIHVDTLGGFGFTIPRPVVVEYKWLGNGQHIPLLQINTTGGLVTQIIYRDSLRINPLSVAPVEQPDVNFNVYPNPFVSNVFIEYVLSKESEIALDVFNLAGENVFSENVGKKYPGNQFLILNLEDKNISSGTYFIRMNVDGRSFSSQPLVKN